VNNRSIGRWNKDGIDDDRFFSFGTIFVFTEGNYEHESVFLMNRSNKNEKADEVLSTVTG
jgi:hypothetical protein